MDSLEQGVDGPHDRAMEARVSRLEDDSREMRAILARLEPMIARIEATLPFLATKQELSTLEVRLMGKIGSLDDELARKLSVAGMWACGATLVALALGGMAAGAVYLPLMFRVMHMTPP